MYLMLALAVLQARGGGGGGAGGGLGGGGGGANAFLIIYDIVVLAVSVIQIIGMWKVFVKAGQPGWAAIIPIYNTIVLLQITDKPIWWFILFCIPFVNLIVAIIVYIELANRFGQGAGYAIGLLCCAHLLAAPRLRQRSTWAAAAEVATATTTMRTTTVPAAGRPR